MATVDICSEKGCSTPGNWKKVHDPSHLPGGSKPADYEILELEAQAGQLCSQKSKDQKDGASCRCMWIIRSYETEDDSLGSHRKKDGKMTGEELVGTWVYRKDFLPDGKKNAKVHAVVCARLSEDQSKRYVTLRPVPGAGDAPKSDDEYKKAYDKAKADEKK